MRFDNNNISLSPIEEENYIQLNNEDFLLRALSKNFEKSKGASSNLFLLSDPSEETEDKVIKICKTPISWGKNKKTKRFIREIRAFKIAEKYKLRNVISFFGNGEVEIDGEVFLYFIMEKAQEDLAEYMEGNRFDFTPNQKLTFCVNILNGIKQLHDKGIYHRDIKHDNILLVNREFKIGDLGLVDFQDDDYEFDYVNEKIGPYGWLSPEATNKMLTNRKDLLFSFDCDINGGSDIFQLGKLFWYVFQGNLPIGQLIEDDYEIKENDIFQVIFSMLQYKRARRPSIMELESLLNPLKVKYGV